MARKKIFESFLFWLAVISSVLGVFGIVLLLLRIWGLENGCKC